MCVFDIFLHSQLCLQLLLYYRDNLVGFYRGAGELDHFSRVVKDKLRKVPRNHFAGFGCWVMQLAVISQVLIEGMGVCSVDLYLLEHREVNVEVLFHKLLDFLMSSTFL